LAISHKNHDVLILSLRAGNELKESGTMWIVLLTVMVFASSMLVLLFFLNHFTRCLSVPVEHLDSRMREILTTAQATHFDTR
jgi:hypothetical protein